MFVGAMDGEIQQCAVFGVRGSRSDVVPRLAGLRRRGRRVGGHSHRHGSEPYASQSAPSRLRPLHRRNVQLPRLRFQHHFQGELFSWTISMYYLDRGHQSGGHLLQHCSI
jgi:hypothetical protein